MMKSYVEHTNMSVVDAQKTINFLTSAIPEWRVRGGGKLDNWFGRAIEWFHVGDEHSYIAISTGGEGDAANWTTAFTGVKHIGIVVPNVDAVVERLALAGYALDHWGGDHPHRKSVYYLEDHGFQFEFVEYFSQENDLKNDYTL
ncbi:lactoylglutathione lyase [Vibrio vulnificus]|nr:lactoylglutathione lyase [Vibrio vulnificus]